MTFLLFKIDFSLFIVFNFLYYDFDSMKIDLFHLRKKF